MPCLPHLLRRRRLVDYSVFPAERRNPRCQNSVAVDERVMSRYTGAMSNTTLASACRRALLSVVSDLLALSPSR